MPLDVRLHQLRADLEVAAAECVEAAMDESDVLLGCRPPRMAARRRSARPQHYRNWTVLVRSPGTTASVSRNYPRALTDPPRRGDDRLRRKGSSARPAALAGRDLGAARRCSARCGLT